MRAILEFPQTYSRLSAPLRGSYVLTLIVILSLLISVAALHSLRDYRLEARMTTSKHMVEAAANSTWFYYNQFVAGKMTNEEARSAALSVLSHLSYGNNNYVYAYSYDHILLVNRVRPDLIGQNRKDAISQDGVNYVQAGVNVAKEGGGFYSYMWDAGGVSPQARAKISYATGVEPWRIMIGTGDYVDDILLDFWNGLSFFMCFSAFCIAVGSHLITWLYSYNGRPIYKS